MESGDKEKTELDKLIDAALGDNEWAVETKESMTTYYSNRVAQGPIRMASSTLPPLVPISQLPPVINARPLYQHKKPYQPYYPPKPLDVTRQQQRQDVTLDNDMAKQPRVFKAREVSTPPLPLGRQYRGDYEEDDDEELHRAIMASLQLSPRLVSDEPTNTSCSTSTASITTATNHSISLYNNLPPTPEEMDDATQLAIEQSFRATMTTNNNTTTTIDNDDNNGLDDATLSPEEREAMRLAIQETRNEQLRAFRDEWKAELSLSSSNRPRPREIKMGSDGRYHVGRDLSTVVPQPHDKPSPTKEYNPHVV